MATKDEKGYKPCDSTGNVLNWGDSVVGLWYDFGWKSGVLDKKFGFTTKDGRFDVELSHEIYKRV